MEAVDGTVTCVSRPCFLGAGFRQSLWRFCNLLMSLFFGLAAYVQINDPDAEMWMVIYMISSILILLLGISPDIAAHVIWKTLCDLHSVVCLMGASYLLCSLFIYGTKSLLHEEEGRELSGLLIIALWLFLCRDSAKEPIGALRLFVAASISIFPLLTWLYIYVNKEMRTSWPQHCKTVI